MKNLFIRDKDEEKQINLKSKYNVSTDRENSPKLLRNIDFFSGLHNCLEFSQHALVIISGYMQTQKTFFA